MKNDIFFVENHRWESNLSLLISAVASEIKFAFAEVALEIYRETTYLDSDTALCSLCSGFYFISSKKIVFELRRLEESGEENPEQQISESQKVFLVDPHKHAHKQHKTFLSPIHGHNSRMLHAWNKKVLFLLHIFPSRQPAKNWKSWMNIWSYAGARKVESRIKNKSERFPAMLHCLLEVEANRSVMRNWKSLARTLRAPCFPLLLKKIISWFPALLNSFQPKSYSTKRLVTDWERLNVEFKIVENRSLLLEENQ